MHIKSSVALSDESLLSLLRADDVNAFKLIYQKYWDSLNNLASHFLNDSDAGKDAVQDLFTHIYANRLKLNIRFSLSAYLQASLHNKLLNYQRSKSIYLKHVRRSGKKEQLPNNNVQLLVDKSNLENNIARCINGLPRRYREVYMLFHQHGYNVKEIALLLDRPTNTADKQLRKIRSFLRSYLKDYR